ncbi:hypothetical protein ACIA8C_37365 [Nocardia sp. NPDC051321]|uniref:hypothetical protein n=1 Tax=Nocardia sp. NPDC051321 TaxID=3364323 RepID=UPI00378C176A
MDSVVLSIGLGVVLMVVLLIVFAALSIRVERQRRNRLQAWGRANGWSFTQHARADWTARLPGRNRSGLGVMLTGQAGGQWVTVADYHYKTTSTSYSSDNSSTTSTTRHHYIAVVVQLHRPYPPIAVEPRGPLSQLGRSLFGDKPTATGNAAFDSRFRIRTSDPNYARWLIGKPLIDAHVANISPPWSLTGQHLLTYRTGRLHDPAMIPAIAAPLLHIANLFPR